MIITLCLSFGIGGMLLINYSFKNSLDVTTTGCMQNFVSIQNTLEIVGENSDDYYYETFKAALTQLNRQSMDNCSYIKLVDVDNNEIVFSSNSSDESKDIKEGNNESVITYSWKDKEKYYYQLIGSISVNAINEGEEIKRFSLFAVYDISSVYKFRNNELEIYQRILVLIIVIGTLLTFIFSILITRPIEQLSKVVKKIADGNIQSRAKIKSGDEIELLSDNINAMAETIENDMLKLTESVEKQERFMGSFAHEMKTPMTSIIGYADLIRSHDLSVDEMRESANYIFKEGKRLEALSLKMLDLILVSNEEINMLVTNPADVIKETAGRLKFVLNRNNILLKTDSENAKVMMDRDLFQSLLNNLIDNAVKAIDNQGVISITGRKNKENYIIQIKDNGRGMSEDEIEKITEAFYRVDKSRSRAQGGAGLGLAICKKIAEVHEAKLAYKSASGEGTEVRVIIKLWNAEVYDEEI